MSHRQCPGCPQPAKTITPLPAAKAKAARMLLSPPGQREIPQLKLMILAPALTHSMTALAKASGWAFNGCVPTLAAPKMGCSSNVQAGQIPGGGGVSLPKQNSRYRSSMHASGGLGITGSPRARGNFPNRGLPKLT